MNHRSVEIVVVVVAAVLALTWTPVHKIAARRYPDQNPYLA